MFRRFLIAVLLILFSSPLHAQQFYVVGSSNPYQWQILPIGGGGQTTSVSICTDGTKYISTDAYGFYKWNGASNRWVQLDNQSSMPAALFGWYVNGGTQTNQNAAGAYAIAAAPSSCGDVYISWGGRVLVSTNRGSTWTDDNFNGGTPFGFNCNTPTPTCSNAYPKLGGPHMLVDPLNANNVILGLINATGTTGAVQYTTNGLSGAGATWTIIPSASIPAPPAATNAIYNAVVVGFDPSSNSGGNTQLVYAGTNGATAGLYVSTTGLSGTWALAASGGPTQFTSLAVEPCFGSGPCRVWAVDNSALWSYSGGSGGTWTKITAANTGWVHVAVDPGSCGTSGSPNTYGCSHIVLSGSGAQLSQTIGMNTATVNSGVTWSSYNGQNWTQPVTVPAGDPTWLANNTTTAPWVGTWSTTGPMVFDPTDNSSGGGLWITTGDGVLYSNPQQQTNQAFTTKTAGIEELVTAKIIAPNGSPIGTSLDKSAWKLARGTTYPSFATTMVQAGILWAGFDIDYASTNSNFMTVLTTGEGSGSTDQTQYSSDGGTTWYPFNNFVTTVATSALSEDSSGTVTGCTNCVQVSLPNTTGLSNWSAGCTQPCNGQFIELLTIGAGPEASGTLTTTLAVSGENGPNTWPIHILSAASCNNTAQPCIDVLGSTYSSSYSAYPGTWVVYSPTNPLASYSTGGYDITNVTGSGCSNTCTQVTVGATGGQLTNSTRACIYGTGTLADGCWRIINTVNGANGHVDLQGSSSTPGAYTLGGTLQTWMSYGGSIAAASANNIVRIPANQNYPQCSTDGGKTWSQLFGPSVLLAGSVTTSDQLTVTLTASGISGGSANFQYTVQAGDTLATIASGLATAANAVTAITGANISAYSVGDVVVLSNGHAIMPAITTSKSGGATETMTVYDNRGGNGTGWMDAYYDAGRFAAADRVQTNLIYLYNYKLGLFSTTNCAQPALVHALNSSGYSGNATVGTQLQTVPNESGHFTLIAAPVPGFLATAPSSSNSFLWRTCDGGSNFYRMPNVFQPMAVGFGLPAPGQSYRSTYIIGWVDPTGANSVSNAVWGYWLSKNDPNHGVNGACNVGGAFTGSITGTTLSVSGLYTGGYMAAGDVITGSGVAANTTITSQLTGATGCTSGSCTFALSGGSQNVSSEAMVAAANSWCELASSCNGGSAVADYPNGTQSGTAGGAIAGDGSNYGYVYVTNGSYGFGYIYAP